MLATELGRPLRIHHERQVKTLDPFFETPPPETTGPRRRETKRGKKKPPPAPVIGPPLDLDARPNPNGRTTYSPHTVIQRARARSEPPRFVAIPARPTRSAPTPAHPDTARVRTRASMRQNTPALPDAPRPAHAEPGHPDDQAGAAPGGPGAAAANLPDFFQDNKALGTITPTDVHGADRSPARSQT